MGEMVRGVEGMCRSLCHQTVLVTYGKQSPLLNLGGVGYPVLPVSAPLDLASSNIMYVTKRTLC